MMSASRRRRLDRGLSILEVLLTLAILSLVIVPLMDLFTTSHRMGSSARRMMDVSLHAQAIVEAFAELQPADFPTVAEGESKVLLADSTTAPGGSTRFQQVADFFNRKPVPVTGMQRTVSAKRLTGGKELTLRIDVEWDAVIGEQRTKQKLSLAMLSTPRNWQ